MRGAGKNYIRRTSLFKGPHRITDRQLAIVTALANGEPIKTVAFNLGISPKTAEYHRAHVMRNLGMYSIAELTNWAISHGLVKLKPTNGIVTLRIDESRREELNKLIREPKHQ